MSIMERILKRPILSVCWQCRKDHRKFGFCSRYSRSGIENLSGALSIQRVEKPASVVHSFLPQYYMSSSAYFRQPNEHQQTLTLGKSNLVLENEKLFPGYFSMVRHFASQEHESNRPLPPRISKSKENSSKSPITWKNLIIIGAFSGVLLLGMTYVRQEKEEARRKAQNKKMGKAKLGGDWTLVDHHGNMRSSTDFRGQWILIYFGFTNCPDICPEEIEKIVSVINKTDSDPQLPKIQPILITVDPSRDTPEALKEYCAEFSPRLLGFSGTEEQIEAATRAYRVYYSAGPKDEDNDYIVDHSIISYLVNPEGEFTEYFGQNKKVDEIYNSARLHILSYMKKKDANQ